MDKVYYKVNGITYEIPTFIWEELGHLLVEYID